MLTRQRHWADLDDDGVAGCHLKSFVESGALQASRVAGPLGSLSVPWILMTWEIPVSLSSSLN
jgi:hypothetical protein